ncbi:MULTISPECIES: GGDEF domain-containing protein [unclassified Halorhodospira]|uniref:GGDEF domain-containing protein n=1 Tax=unclassified Halorhodospira TaxID=2626748 RepID=UPI001EE7E840|nr:MULTISPECIES: GGDEF domain-containing protein [unclassified Halorhodospira]MCG5541571.1 GGDEF domain-containing protein [Halorhodospira sp. M39old]MCG5544634.1 GGDEF domain-containing protein [Halorhodospira sp. M38]
MAAVQRLLSSTWLLHLLFLAALAAWIVLLDAPFPRPAIALLEAHSFEFLAIAGGMVAVLALLYRRANLALQAAAISLAISGIGVAPSPAHGVTAAAILLPINLLILTLLDDRGLLSRAGLWRCAALALQALLVLGLFRYQPDWLEALAATTFLPLGLADWSSLPEQGLLLAALAAASLLLWALLDPTPPHVGAFSALLTTTLGLELALARGGELVLPTLLGAVALFLLLVAVLQEAHRMAFRDGLTGLPNRRAMDSLTQGLSGSYAIAMTDVDHFKSFNDTHGHEVGDQVLRRVAASIGRVGAGGHPFRYGGEEFAVVFPGRTAEQVVEALETVRETIASTPFRLRGSDRPADDRHGSRKRGIKRGRQQTQITISIGVADSSTATDADAVVQAADQALYRAKKGGRNRLAQ